jgi:hypothetical protein
MNLSNKFKLMSILLCFVLSTQSIYAVYAAPVELEISAEGELCSQTYGVTFCFPLTFTFDTEGGSVSGQSSGSTSFPIEGVGTIVSSFSALFNGTFEGGDGGKLEGTWTSTANVTLPDGLSLPPDMPALTQSSAGGTWSGNLYADGTGSGTFQAVDSFGASSSGTWQVTYSGSAFETPEPTQATQPTQTALPSAAAATTAASPTIIPPTPTIVPTPGLTLDPQALLVLGDLQSAIQKQLERFQSGDLSDYPAALSRWLNGEVVRVNVGNETLVVSDIYGHRVEVDENGLPQSDPSVIESPSAEVVNNHQDLAWPSILDSISESAYKAFNNFTEPTFQFIEETTEGIEPTEIASSFYAYLAQLSTPPVEELTQKESSVLKTEGAIHASNNQLEQQKLEGPDGEKVDVKEAVEKVAEEQEDTWRRHYVEVLEIISAERWDELVSQGIDPVQLIRNRETADETLVKFNEFFGGQSMSDLAVKFDLLPEEVSTMKSKLKALGVHPDKVEELAQATLVLRVITELASDHTFSSDGYFDKVVWAFRFLAVNKASQDALMDELEGKVQLTPEQIDLIMENRGSSVVEALTGEQDAKNDPLLQALMQEIGRRESK